MKLVSSNGVSISLHPAAYQFEMPPPAEDEDEDEGDANWLMIRGAVRAADGRRWAFLDPCLTTSEARSLSAWLRRVAGGDATEEPRSIAFTEPNLAFSAGDQSADRVHLQVRFSHEALPPWIPRDRKGWQAGTYDLFLDTAREDLVRAADIWDLEHEPFPER